MNDIQDSPELDPPEDSGDFDPRAAAALLAQAQRSARRQFDANSIPLSLFRAVIVLAAYGALWLSVRGQHPYTGPAAWAIFVVYLLVAIIASAGLRAYKRATEGVTGRSQRQRQAMITASIVVWVATYVFMGSLRYLGISHGIVYGVYPAVGPLLIPGSFAAGVAAVREDWFALGLALPIIAVGAIAPYFGPVGVWGACAVGLCAVLLIHTAVTALLARRPAAGLAGGSAGVPQE